MYVHIFVTTILTTNYWWPRCWWPILRIKRIANLMEKVTKILLDAYTWSQHMKIFPSKLLEACHGPTCTYIDVQGIDRLNSEDFSNFFLCSDIIFLPRNVEIFFKYSWIFMIFSTFSRLFVIKLFCAARCSHVLCIIRFLIKFHIGLFMSHRCETLWENTITCFISLTGIENCVGSLKIK